MNRVITNTFTLTAVKDNEAVRDNLIHCSLMNKNRMTWWGLPDPSEVRYSSELVGKYAIMGYTGWEWLAKPGKIASVSQPLAMYDRNNTGISNSALKNNTWYTLTFRSLGTCMHFDENDQAVDKGTGYMYVYIYPSVVDTKTKYIVDGAEKWPSGDMATPIPVTWTPKEHTITFKTASSFSSMPRILFRSFGEGNTQYDNPSTNYYPFKEGGCLVRIAGVKLEEAREATAFKPHITEYQPPIHATAFKRTNDNLTKAPEGGSYTSPTPTGWSDGIPSDTTARLWTTKAVFLPEETTAAWSKPSPVGDTVDLDVEFSPYTGIPTTDIDNPNNLAPSGTAAASDVNKWFDPTRNPTADFSIMVWRAERKILNGVKSSWVISKIKGEDGTSFTAKGSADKHYASLSAYNAATDRVVGKYYLVDSTSGAVMYKYNESTAIACDDGDAYTTSDLHLWVKNGPIWADLGKIQGPQGAQGPQGEGGMSCTLVPSVQSIPVDSNGRPTISKFTLTAKIYKGSTLMGENDKTYSIVSHVSYKGVTTPVTSSTNASFNLDVNLDETKVLNSVTCFIQRGQTVLHKFYLYPHANGQNTVRLDLDNEMDSVVCDNNGNLLAETTIQTTLRLYDGATMKASEQYGQLKEADFVLNGIIPVKTESSDGMTCTFSWTFNAGRKFSDARYIKDFSIQYNGTFYLATFTLNAMRNGKNGVDGVDGDDAVRYNVSPSESAVSFQRTADNAFTPNSKKIYCNVVVAVGGYISIINNGDRQVDGKYLYYSIDGSSWNSMIIGNNDGAGLLVYPSYTSVKFCLSTASNSSNVGTSNIIDIETVPVVIDGSNGSNGSNGADGVSIDFFASANTIMMGDTGVELSSVIFKATMAEGSNSPSVIISGYKIEVDEYLDDGTIESGYGNSKCEYEHSIYRTTTLAKLVAKLIKTSNSTTIRTLTIPVVKKGADGRSYNPVPRGIYAAGNTYVWNAIQRDYVDYEFDGVYYRFGVKTFGMEVTAAPTKAEGDDYWEVCNRVSCLITNCIFGTNAVIGGFVATAGKFMSTENAYALRYMRLYETLNKVNYIGSYSGGISYSQNDAVYHNGTYYYSMISGNTATPSGSSNWASCSSLLIERIKEVGVGTVYLYEYDNATLKRPVVQYGGTYYTIKKMGAATALPTASNSNWRELTDTELSFLSVGTGSETTSILSYVPKYTLNGKNGTVMMLQADDTCWTYDDTGKQVNGIPYGKRIEIVPASKSIDVYDDSGDLALQVNGDTYETIDKAYGSGILNLSCSKVSGDLSSNTVGSSKTTMLFLTSSSGFNVEDYPLNLSVTSAFKVTASEYHTATTPNGNYGGIIALPSNVGGLWVYRNDCRGMIMVQKLGSDSVSWSNHNLLVSISTVGLSGTIARYSGTTSCVLQPGKYRLVFIFSAELFGMSNTDYNSSYCYYEVKDISASGSYAIQTSRVFANGLAFGSATNDNFVVVREPGGIHVKASTESGHGLELSQTKGLEVKRNGYQGASLPVLFVARTTYLSENAQKKYEYLYWNEALGKPTMTWTARGVCEIVLGSDYPTSEHIMPTLTSYAAPEMGVSARIKSWSGQKIIIELDSDYNSPNDYGGFYIKLEYIGEAPVL